MIIYLDEDGVKQLATLINSDLNAVKENLQSQVTELKSGDVEIEGVKTFKSKVMSSAETPASEQAMRNLAIGSASVTTTLCPNGCWYGKY